MDKIERLETLIEDVEDREWSATENEDEDEANRLFEIREALEDELNELWNRRKRQTGGQ